MFGKGHCAQWVMSILNGRAKSDITGEYETRWMTGSLCFSFAVSSFSLFLGIYFSHANQAHFELLSKATSTERSADSCFHSSCVYGTFLLFWGAMVCFYSSIMCLETRQLASRLAIRGHGTPMKCPWWGFWLFLDSFAVGQAYANYSG